MYCQGNIWMVNGKQHTGGQCETCGIVAIPIKIVEKEAEKK